MADKCYRSNIDHRNTLVVLLVLSSALIGLISSTPLRATNVAVLPRQKFTYRLPNDTIPLNYKVDIRTRVDLDELNYTGTVRISLQCVIATNRIVIHHRQLTIGKVELRKDGIAAGTGLEGLTVTYDPVPEFLIIASPQALIAGQMYTLDIAYTGKLRDDMAGFYRGSYTDHTGKVK